MVDSGRSGSSYNGRAKEVFRDQSYWTSYQRRTGGSGLAVARVVKPALEPDFKVERADIVRAPK
jgi:hypothetical protein